MIDKGADIEAKTKVRNVIMMMMIMVIISMVVIVAS